MVSRPTQSIYRKIKDAFGCLRGVPDSFRLRSFQALITLTLLAIVRCCYVLSLVKNTTKGLFHSSARYMLPGS